MATNVNADEVDFSDRVDGKRKSYKSSTRRQRTLEDGTVEFGELSDDDDEESLERRIARLKREVEEAKDEYAKRKRLLADQKNAGADGDENLGSLSRILDEISRPTRIGKSVTTLEPIPAASRDKTEEQMGDRATYTITYAPTYEQSHALSKAADFDRRLVMLENGLGIASSTSETGETGLPRAILPTLDAMEKQIMTLSQASTSSLDTISRRVRALAAEQDKLNDSREKAKILREELGKHTGGTPPPEDFEQEAKVNALYGILPTIESLTPILPPLLDRLRSLRAIHADAATAAQTLERIERQQAEMAAELRQWTEGLEKTENAMREGDRSIQGNMKVMEGWVKELEERVARLG